MSQDEITPARLRELADKHERYAGVEKPHAFDVKTAAALRAAASVIEEERKRSDTAGDLVAGMNEENLRLTATLAAREALLTKALDVLEDHFLHRRLALAAEIAAALGGTDD